MEKPQAISRTALTVDGRILVIQSRYYERIATPLLAGARAAISAAGAACDVVDVAGALEIPQALALAAGHGLIGRPGSRFCGAVALGCVIRGETAHYDIVCTNANHWLMEIAIGHKFPLGNAILTVDTEAQALARATHGQGKGHEAAQACLNLVALGRSFADTPFTVEPA